MKSFRFFLVILFSLLLVSNLYAGKIYVWKDEKGVKHFSDSPPPKKTKGIKVLKFQETKEGEKDHHNAVVSQFTQDETIERFKDLLLKEKSKEQKTPIGKSVKGIGYDLKDMEKRLGSLRNVEEHYHFIWMSTFLVVVLVWVLIWMLRRSRRHR